ncbi:hypothetical protein MAR_036658, partial [Mya arenaria]
MRLFNMGAFCTLAVLMVSLSHGQLAGYGNTMTNYGYGNYGYGGYGYGDYGKGGVTYHVHQYFPAKTGGGGIFSLLIFLFVIVMIVRLLFNNDGGGKKHSSTSGYQPDTHDKHAYQPDTHDDYAYQHDYFPNYFYYPMGTEPYYYGEHPMFKQRIMGGVILFNGPLCVVRQKSKKKLVQRVAGLNLHSHSDEKRDKEHDSA